jgi:hypothetical protein
MRCWQRFFALTRQSCHPTITAATSACKPTASPPHFVGLTSRSPAPEGSQRCCWPAEKLPVVSDGKSTQRSRRWFSRRANGLPWTFADAVEKVMDDDGHSRVAIIDRGKIPAERLHPKAAYSRCRPVADLRQPRFKAAELPIIQPRARGGARACQTQVHEDFLAHRPLQDGRNESELPSPVAGLTPPRRRPQFAGCGDPWRIAATICRIAAGTGSMIKSP